MSDDINQDSKDKKPNASSSTERRKRVVGRPFKKGQSGNPTGNKKDDDLWNVRRLAREWTDDAISALVEVIRDPKQSGVARVLAAKKILDRGHGAAPRHVVIDGEIEIEKLDDLQLNEVIKREIRRLLGVDIAEKEADSPTDKLEPINSKN